MQPDGGASQSATYHVVVAMPILATKLYVPPRRSRIVLRPRLDERLNEGLQRRLTLVSAPAGFGKSTLLAEWVAECGLPVAWLSLDEGDAELTRFLAYLVEALRTVRPGVGEGVLAALGSSQPPPVEATLTPLVNELAALPTDVVLVLDDYHSVDGRPVDQAVAFLLEHRPSRVHLTIATREDPALPLARWRARAELTEIRAADLRFTPDESAAFLNQVMGLGLSTGDVSALEMTTEGWVAGLQLAAISLQGHEDASEFIRSFSGSHRFVLDYLVEEVVGRQPPEVREFLLRTSILDRLCGPLCDAVILDPLHAWPADTGAARAREPVHRSARQRASLVSLPPPLPRPAAPAAWTVRVRRGRGRAPRPGEPVARGQRLRPRRLPSRRGRPRHRTCRAPGHGPWPVAADQRLLCGRWRLDLVAARGDPGRPTVPANRLGAGAARTRPDGGYRGGTCRRRSHPPDRAPWLRMEVGMLGLPASWNR